MAGLRVSDVYTPYEVLNTAKILSTEKPKKTESKRDEVALSDQAKDYQILTKALADLPDIREDVVSAVKAKYDSGSYDIASENIAASLFSKWAALD